jgi:hypothetical protein
MDYNLFKKIITCFNKKASDAIIRGGLLYLGNNLGYSQIRKIIPIKRSDKINWQASYEYKNELIAKGVKVREKGSKEGENWLIYQNDPWYLRWSWIKHYSSGVNHLTCRVKNNRVYAFYTTSNRTRVKGVKGSGNKGKLVTANEEDPLLHTRYFTMNMKDYRKEKRSEKLDQAA